MSKKLRSMEDVFKMMAQEERREMSREAREMNKHRRYWARQDVGLMDSPESPACDAMIKIEDGAYGA